MGINGRKTTSVISLHSLPSQAGVRDLQDTTRPVWQTINPSQTFISWVAFGFPQDNVSPLCVNSRLDSEQSDQIKGPKAAPGRQVFLYQTPDRPGFTQFTLTQLALRLPSPPADPILLLPLVFLLPHILLRPLPHPPPPPTKMSYVSFSASFFARKRSPPSPACNAIIDHSEAALTNRKATLQLGCSPEVTLHLTTTKKPKKQTSTKTSQERLFHFATFSCTSTIPLRLDAFPLSYHFSKYEQHIYLDNKLRKYRRHV